jgi:hypothetical protein
MWPANGREDRSVAPKVKTTVSQLAKINCPNTCEKSGLRFVRSVRCEGKIGNEPPIPFPTLPASPERGPHTWHEIVTIMKWGWVFEKSRLLQALKFDKRWLKYTVPMEDCSYLRFLDDYRVLCVKKRNFYRPPSAATSVP